MELHILIDNLPAENTASDTPKEYYRDGKGICNAEAPYLHHEHGLCILFSLNGKHWMIDTGASGKAIENMQKMYSFGMPVCTIGEIEAVFVSHGHNDHTGGLRHFIESNPDAPIYLHKEIRGNLFFSCRPRPAKTDAAKTNTAQTDAACGSSFAAATACDSSSATANNPSADTPCGSSFATATACDSSFAAAGTSSADTAGISCAIATSTTSADTPSDLSSAAANAAATACASSATAGTSSAANGDTKDTLIKEFRSIGMEQALFAEYGDRFREIESPTRITDKITLIPITGGKLHPTPMGNEFLYKNDFPDNFSHETAILIEHTEGKFAVISPCTHNGILNVLECCRNHITHGNSNFSCTCSTNGKPNNGTTGAESTERGEITHFIGGLHYVDYLSMGEGEKELRAISGVAQTLKAEYPNLKIYSGHCTCAGAGAILKEILGENYSTFRTGTRISIK